MAKFKVALLIILAVLLVDFAVENTQPLPVLKLFKFNLGTFPTYLLAYGSLALGLIVGWVWHLLGVRRKKRKVAAAASTTPQQE